MSNIKIMLFEDFTLDSDTSDKLKLSQFKDVPSDKYFFKKKPGGDLFDAHIFEVEIKSIESFHEAVYFDMMVSYKMQEYPIMMCYKSDETVTYSIPEDESLLSKFEKAMGRSNMDIFNDTTQQILDTYLPGDFWEVRSKRS